MKKIDSLFKSTNTGYPLNKRYPPKLIESYLRDLRYVIKQVEEGQCLPTRRELKEYFFETYEIEISEGAIHRHITTLKKGGKLWR
jgi:hypothetical protein